MSHAGGNGEKLVKKSAGGLGRVAEDHVSAVVLAGRHMKAKSLTLFIVRLIGVLNQESRL